MKILHGPMFVALGILFGWCPLACASPDSDGGAVKAGFHTLAHDVLRIERPSDAEYEPRARELDRIIQACLNELDQSPTPTDDEKRAIRFFETTHRILIRNNFVFPFGDKLVPYLGDSLVGQKFSKEEIVKLKAKGPNGIEGRREQIDRNAGGFFFVSDCDTSSMIYLAVAEVKKYPCFLVEIPGHNFVRWAGLVTSVNWETNYGMRWSDENYRSGAHLPDVVPRETHFLGNMTRTEVLSYWTQVAAGRWEELKDYAVQGKLFEQAYQMTPDSVEIGNSIAWFLATCPSGALRDGKRAVKIAESVVAIWPNPDFIDTLAAAYAETRDFARAEQTEIRAVKATGTWERSEFQTGTWSDFSELVKVYHDGKTYAEYKASLRIEPMRRAPPPKTEKSLRRNSGRSEAREREAAVDHDDLAGTEREIPARQGGD